GIGYLVFTYAMPGMAFRPEIISGFAFTMIVAALGLALLIRNEKKIRSLADKATNIAQAFSPTWPVERHDNELRTLNSAITRMGEVLNQQVTELKSKNEELAELNLRLEVANRQLLEIDRSKSELMILATREFRDPITRISEAASLLNTSTLGELNEKQT